MTGKKHKKHKSSSKKPDQAKSEHVKEITDSTSVGKSPQVNTFQSDEDGGIKQVRPSLAIKNVDIGFCDENLRESSDNGRPIRLKAPNKTVNEEEVRAEKALQAKHRRSGHLGELRKRRNFVQDLIESSGVQEAELEDALARYEETFHKFC